MPSDDAIRQYEAAVAAYQRIATRLIEALRRGEPPAEAVMRSEVDEHIALVAARRSLWRKPT